MQGALAGLLPTYYCCKPGTSKVYGDIKFRFFHPDIPYWVAHFHISHIFIFIILGDKKRFQSCFLYSNNWVNYLRNFQLSAWEWIGCSNTRWNILANSIKNYLQNRMDSCVNYGNHYLGTYFDCWNIIAYSTRPNMIN
jgi:hypothetical protein